MMTHRLPLLCLLGLLLLIQVLAASDEASFSSDNHALEQRLAPLKAQADKGDLHAAQQVYMRYGVSGFPEQARAWAERYNELLAQQAAEGDTNAMLQLGARFLRGGDYTPQSIPKATEWFSRAGEAGDPTGLYMLGEIFSKAGNAVQPTPYTPNVQKKERTLRLSTGSASWSKMASARNKMPNRASPTSSNLRNSVPLGRKHSSSRPTTRA